MAPAIKELSRWLDANTEYCVAPDWADVVKHSVSSMAFSLSHIHINAPSNSFIRMLPFLIRHLLILNSAVVRNYCLTDYRCPSNPSLHFP